MSTKFHSNMYGWEYVWRDFADSKGGQVVEDQTKTNSPIVSMHIPVEGTDTSVNFAPFRLKGDKKGDKGTAATIHFAPRENFVFSIRSEKGMDQIGKMMGLQDIQMGDQEFDERFLIQGSDPGKVVHIFAEMDLRDLLLGQNTAELRLVQETEHFPTELKVPKGRHAVVFNHNDRVDKFEQLEAIFLILTSTVHRLGAIPAIAGDEIDEPAQEQQRTSGKLHSPLLDMA